MSNPLGPWNAWFALSAQATRTCWEAQAVIWLRGLRIAQGGAKAEAETTRMITEKVAALAEDSGSCDDSRAQRQQETSCSEESIRRLREARSSQQAQARKVKGTDIAVPAFPNRPAGCKLPQGRSRQWRRSIAKTGPTS